MKELNCPTAKEMKALNSGYKAWNSILDGMRSATEYGKNSYPTANLCEDFKVQLAKLEYKVTYTCASSGFTISWDQEPTIQDYDSWINELTALRDELRKKQLTESLAGI